MPTPSPSLSEAIETASVMAPISEIATYLQDHLGQKSTAYLSGLKDAKMVGQWAKGKVQPRSAATLRLRNAYQAVRLLTEAFGEQTASAWLFGTNSYLGDEAPAYVLRHGDQPAQITPVVVAARSFIESAGPDGAVMEEAALPSAPTDALRRRVRSLEASQMKLDQQLQDLTRELRRATSERAAG